MSKEQASLCEHIIYEAFGDDVGYVAHHLIQQGRLSYPNLCRICAHPPGASTSTTRSLTKKQVRQCLLILIQQNLVSFSNDAAVVGVEQDGSGTEKGKGDVGGSKDQGDEFVGTEYFEMREEEVLARERFGRFVEDTEQTLGQVPAEIVRLVLLNGKLRIGTILDDLSEMPLRPEDAELPPVPTAGSTDRKGKGRLKLGNEIPIRIDHEKRKSLFPHIHALLSRRLLLPTSRSHHISPIDKLLAWEKEMIRELKGAPTPKQMKEIKERVQERRLRELEEIEQWEDSSASTMRGGGTKRKATSAADTRPRKRRAVADDEDVEGIGGIDEDLMLRVNYSAFDVKYRNKLIVGAVAEKFNPVIADVMKAALKVTEQKQKSLGDERSAPVSLSELTLAYIASQPSVARAEKELRSCFAPSAPIGPDPENPTMLASKATPTDLVREVLRLLLASDDQVEESDLVNEETGELLPGAGEGLASKREAFMSIDKETTANGHANGTSRFHQPDNHKYVVEFKKIGRLLKLNLLGGVVRRKFGQDAWRIMKILMKKGKLDEKHIQKLAFLPNAHSRELMTRLSAFPFIETQEIPKTKDRAPNKTVFLWYVDLDKCYANLLSRLHESVTKSHYRMALEMDKKRAQLEKAERRDIKESGGIESEYFTAVEKWELETLELKMEALIVARERLDRDIFILRDLPS